MSTIEERLQELNDLGSSIDSTSGRLRAMLYGPIGSGKTTLAAGIAQKINRRGKHTLFIDTSEGWESLKKFPSLAATVRQIPFTTIDDLKLIAQAIRENRPGLFEDIGTVIVDEASTIGQYTIDSLWSRRYQEVMTSGTQRQKDALEPNPQWPDYHAALIQVRNAFLAFYRIPDLHVIHLAHVGEVRNEKGMVIGYRPAFPEKMANALDKDMHLVGYVSAKEQEIPGTNTVQYTRMVQVLPTPAIVAKSRIKGLDQVRYEHAEVVSIIEDWMNTGAELTGETMVTEVQDLPEDIKDGEVNQPTELDETLQPVAVDVPQEPVELPSLPAELV